MDNYEYKVLIKENFMVYPETEMIYGENSETGESKLIRAEPPSFFDTKKFEQTLALYGKEGFRVIEYMYNAPHSWVLILSRQIIVSDEEAYVFRNRRQK